MSPSAEERGAENSPSTTDLPYGPVPVRPDEPDEAQSPAEPRDQILRLSWLEPDPGPGEDAASHEQRQPLDEGTTSRAGHRQGADGADEQAVEHMAEHPPGASSELDLATARDDSDDDVHFGVAAKALGVSRKTIERMVKRGQLERGPSEAPATVSKRALVTVLEQRRRELSPSTAGTSPVQRKPGNENLDAAWSLGTNTELQELLRPVLEPLLEEIVAASTRAALLESQIESIAARSVQERERDELLLALATGSWRQRRKARKRALRHYVLGDDVEP